MPRRSRSLFRFSLRRMASGGVFAPLRNRTFAAIWTAALFSNFGIVIQSVGAAWLMTSIAPTPDYVALVQAAMSAPMMLFALISGAMADTIDRRRLMLAAQILVLVASLAVALANWAGIITPWTLLFFTFLIGVSTSLYAPAWQSSVSDIVARDKVPAAIGLQAVNFNLARSAGPAVGGAIIALAGVTTAFFFNTVSVIGLIVVLWTWRYQRPAQALAPERLDRAVVSGVRYVALSPALRVAMLRAALFGLSASAIQSLMPLVARDVLGGGPFTFGALLGAFGVGAMAGGFGSVRLRSRLGPQGLAIWGSAAFGASSIVLGLSPWVALSMLALFVAGACWTLSLSTFNITVQTSAPRWVTGRALAAYQMSVFGGLALGSVVSGQIARSAGTEEALIFAGVAMLVGLMAARRYSLRQVDAANLNPHTLPLNNLPALDLEPRAGPIIVTLEYRVPRENAREFVEAANRLARLRRRDGASDWVLIQDLDDPERWIERFQSPTWLDHLRRQSRMTVGTHAASELVRTFHRGKDGAPPIVHRYIERPEGSDSYLADREVTGESDEDRQISRSQI